MVIERGDICWVDLGARRGSTPAKRRPTVIVQADPYNRSRLATTIVAVITSRTHLAAQPGNVFLPASASGLPKDSVINVTAIATLDRSLLDRPTGHLPDSVIRQLDDGLRATLGLRHV